MNGLNATVLADHSNGLLSDCHRPVRNHKIAYRRCVKICIVAALLLITQHTFKKI